MVNPKGPSTLFWKSHPKQEPGDYLRLWMIKVPEESVGA